MAETGEPFLEDGKWRERLRAAISARGLTMRGVSIKAGRGMGYVYDILEDGKMPSINKLARVCEAVGVSIVEILYGVPMTADVERLLTIYVHLDDHQKKLFLTLAETTLKLQGTLVPPAGVEPDKRPETADR